MGLQINKALNRADGLTIPSGAVVSWSTCFIAGSRNIEFRPLLVFLSVQDRDDYFNGVEGAPQPTMSDRINDMSAMYFMTMTVEEQASLETESGAFSKVEGWLKDLIVANSNEYLADGDVAIIA